MIAGHMVALFLVFWGSPYCLLQWSHQFTFPPAVYGGSFFPTTSPTLIITCPVDNSHSNSDVVSHCGFNLHFPNGWWSWTSFHISVGHVYVFLGEISIQVLCPFFNCFFGFLVFWFFVCLFVLFFVELYEFFVSFGY